MANFDNFGGGGEFADNDEEMMEIQEDEQRRYLAAKRKKEMYKKNKKKKIKNVLDINHLKKLNKVDDSILENLLKYLYVGSNVIRVDYLFTLITSLSFNPYNENK